MNILRKPLTISIILFSYSSLNLIEIFGINADKVQNIFYIIRIITAISGFITFIYVQKFYDKKKIKLYFNISLFLIFILFSSIINMNLNANLFIKFILALGLYYYLIYCTFNYESLLIGLRNFYLIILFLNIFFYLFFPSIGVYTKINGLSLLKGILVNRNSVLIYTLPLVILNNIIDYKNKYILKIINLISILVIILTGSNTAIVVVFFYSIMINLPSKKIKSKSIIIGILILFICLVLFNYNNNFIGYIIKEIIGSDLTLSGRKIIWNKVLFLIPHKIFWGYGIGSNNIASEMLYSYATNGHLINDPFNGLLNIIFFNGLFGFSFLIYFIYKSFNNLEKIKNDKNTKYFCILILSFLFISISESIFQFTYFIFWSFIILTIDYKKNIGNSNE